MNTYAILAAYAGFATIALALTFRTHRAAIKRCVTLLPKSVAALGRGLTEYYTNRSHLHILLRSCSIVACAALCLFFFSKLPNPLDQSRVDTFFTYNHYNVQARSWINGRLDIPDPIPDGCVFKDKLYVVYGLYPTHVYLPLVAVFGEKFFFLVLGLVVFALSVLFMARTLRRLSVSNENIVWLLMAFFWGTGYWMVLRSADGVSSIAHIFCVLMLIMTFCETVGRSRGWLIGLFLGGAFLSRFLAIFFFVFVLAYLWGTVRYGCPAKRIRNILSFLLTFGLCFCLYCGYNWMRFGNVMETGYTYVQTISFVQARIAEYGITSLHFVPFNFVHMFIQGFHIEFTGDDLLTVTSMDPFGTALTIASPFVFVALWARWNPWALVGGWISVALVILSLLCVHNNGWVQYNCQRYTLDFLPFAMIFVARGLDRVHPLVWRSLIAISLLLNVITLQIVPS